MPGELVAAGHRIAISLDRVVPSATPQVLTIGKHAVATLAGDLKEFLVAGQVVEPREAPGNFQVMSDNSPVLLPGIGVVGCPGGIEPLVDKRAGGIGEVRGYEESELPEALKILRVARAKIKVFQIGGQMVANRVPVLFQLVDPLGIRRAERAGVDVGEVALCQRVGRCLVPVIVVHEPDRFFNVCKDDRIAGCPEILGQPGDTVDLLVEGNGAGIV